MLVVRRQPRLAGQLEGMGESLLPGWVLDLPVPVLA